MAAVVASALALALALAPARPAAAQPEAAPARVYRVRWAFDLSVLTAASATWVGLSLARAQIVTPSCPCRGDELNALDRRALGLRSPLAGTASDVAVGALVALPFALDALDVRSSGGPWRAFAEDALVMAQTVAVNGALSQIAKVAVQRPRPGAHDVEAPDSPAVRDPDSYTSFYSGHTSTAFAATVGYASTFALRHAGSRWRPFVYGAAIATGGGVALLRVAAGAHFPTDVAAGAAAGAALGLLVPRLHRGRLAPVAMPVTAGAAVGVAGRF